MKTIFRGQDLYQTDGLKTLDGFDIQEVRFPVEGGCLRKPVVIVNLGHGGTRIYSGGEAL